MGTYAVLSDDLTGATDSGVQLVRKGFKVSVAVHRGSVGEMAGISDVVVVNTQTRNVPPEAAFGIVADAVRSIKNAGLRLVYKKVDSTLRGNIGKELEAVIKESEFDMVLFAPALPFNGRVIRGGYHFVDGFMLTETDLAKDPFAPVKSSYVPEIIGYQTSTAVGSVAIDEVRCGIESIMKKLSLLHSKGVRIAVADAENTNDLKYLADAAEKSDMRILACGSAGLFSQMFGHMGKPCDVKSVPPPDRAGPALVISGSPARVNKMQLQAAAQSGEEVIRLDCGKACENGREWQAEVRRVRDSALKSLARGRNVIIDGAGKSKNEIYIEFRDKPEMLAISSSIIQAALEDIFECVIEKACISGAMIIGGDTAANICRRMNASGLALKGEVEPFIPAGRIIGGKADGLPIVTKAGGFGSEDVIIKVLEFLRGEKE